MLTICTLCLNLATVCEDTLYRDEEGFRGSGRDYILLNCSGRLYIATSETLAT